jgi:hypothetical protein
MLTPRLRPWRGEWWPVMALEGSTPPLRLMVDMGTRTAVAMFAVVIVFVLRGSVKDC